jgi:HEAT repeat protein
LTVVELQHWALVDQSRLVSAITSGTLEPTLLTFAAEIAGAALSREVIVPVLLQLLAHPHPAVREGAIYGLQGHEGTEIYAELKRIGRDDPSPGVREAALEALEER